MYNLKIWSIPPRVSCTTVCSVKFRVTLPFANVFKNIRFECDDSTKTIVFVPVHDRILDGFMAMRVFPEQTDRL